MSVPEAALLSPSTVVIKASGGRQEGWTEQEEEETRMYDWLIYVTEKGGHVERGRRHHFIILMSGSRVLEQEISTKKACLNILIENLTRKQRRGHYLLLLWHPDKDAQ